jgi:hypothetical protein
MTMAKQLNPGDQFPNYIVQLADGGTLSIPQDLRGEYAVIIFSIVASGDPIAFGSWPTTKLTSTNSRKRT